MLHSFNSFARGCRVANASIPQPHNRTRSRKSRSLITNLSSDGHFSRTRWPSISSMKVSGSLQRTARRSRKSWRSSSGLNFGCKGPRFWFFVRTPISSQFLWVLAFQKNVCQNYRPIVRKAIVTIICRLGKWGSILIDVEKKFPKKKQGYVDVNLTTG